MQLLELQSPDADVGQIVNLDLEVIGPDLSAVPLNEVLDFRSAHGGEFRAYARRLREIVRELSRLPHDEHARVLEDRREEIREAGDALRRGPLNTLGSVAAVGLGIAGGVVSAAAGAPLGGILSAAAAGAGLVTLPGKTVTPYSYLFSVRSKFA